VKRFFFTPRWVDAAGLAALLVVVFALGALVDAPAWKQWRALRAELDDLHRAGQETATIAARTAEMEREIEQLKKAAGRMTAGIPASMETYLVLQDLGPLSRECRVTLDHVVPGSIVSGERFATIPVNMQLRGSFHPLLRFLARAEEGAHPLRVERLSLSRGEQAADMNMEVGLEVTCLAGEAERQGTTAP
jgi:Tfp pilus assembly protein PilO